MKERKTYLDIIRSSSVLIIVLFHFSCLLEDFNYKGYNNFFLHYANGKWGRVGVFLFFMISGAGLMLSSKKGFEWKKFLKTCVHLSYLMCYNCLKYEQTFVFCKKVGTAGRTNAKNVG